MRVATFQIGGHAVREVEQACVGGGALAQTRRLAEGSCRLREEAAREKRAPSLRPGRGRPAVQLRQQGLGRGAEHRSQLATPGRHDARHRAFLRVSGEQEPELAFGLAQQRVQLLERFVDAYARCIDQLLELAQEPALVVHDSAAERAHLRAVGGALIEVLAELHRLVKERSHGEIEERGRPDLAVCPLTPEQDVAALLQAEQHAAVVVADELADLVEGQRARAIALAHLPQQAVGGDKLPHDLDQARLDRRHGRSIGGWGSAALSIPCAASRETC